MELNVYPERWNLPSADPDSLIAITYAQFCKAQIDIKRVEGVKLLGSELPFLHSSFSDTPITGFENIIDHLRFNVTDTDSHLEGSQRSDLKVFSGLVCDALLPALKHTLWLDPCNFLNTSKPAWSSLTTFPLSIYLPIHHRNRVKASFKNNFKYKHLSEEALSLQVMSTGKEVINLLSAKLAHQQFFFGDKPTSIDAILFGCLAPLLHISLPSRALHIHLRGCPNLVAYCQRILEQIFPESAAKLSEAKSMEEEKVKEKTKKSLELGDFPNKRRDIFIGLALAAASMLVYALTSGKLVKIMVVRDEGSGRRERR